MIIINVNLSNIDKKFVRKGKNGNSYLSLIINRRREKSEYGETHTVAISKSKAERELDDSVIYVGGGIGYYEDAMRDNALDNLTGGDTPEEDAPLRTPERKTPTDKDIPTPNGDDYDDLPF